MKLMLIIGALLASFSFQVGAGCSAVMTVKSYHSDRTKGYNESNIGYGGECEVARNVSLAAGYYRNSVYVRTNYLTVKWLPIDVLGYARLGGAVGIMTGYQENPQKWSPAAVFALDVPVHERLGVSLYGLPGTGDLPSVVGMQLYYKIN